VQPPLRIEYDEAQPPDVDRDRSGTTVTWQNSSGTGHTVTWNDAAGRNAALAGDGTGDIDEFSSGSHTRLFNAPGVYPFHCTIHAGMNGTLTVQQ